jgi:hypothetical protein
LNKSTDHSGDDRSRFTQLRSLDSLLALPREAGNNTDIKQARNDNQ